jgi:N-acyl amino acid synthase of PEP-CTERM/exosortase system
LDQALRDAKATTAKERREALRSVRTPWIALGLYLSAAAIGLIKGLDGVFALMQPRLANHLVIHGLNFVQVGEPIEHRGTRAPYFISRADLYAGVAPWIRGLLEVIVSDLRKTGADAMMPTVPRSRRGQASGS